MKGTNGGQRHRRAHWVLGCLLVTVSAIGVAEAAEEVCRSGCKGGSHTFKYAVGTTYTYDYDGKIEISLSSAEGQSTGTEVKAQVLLTQQSDCNQVLRLKNVQILDSKGKRLGAIENVEKPIRINFNDGVLEDSVCIEDGDTQNSINIKRAVASAFQTSLKSNYETDIFGRCPTDTTSHKEGAVLVVQKTRNLNKCAYREHIQQDFLATAFNIHSEIKSSPILNGEYNAKQRIKNGILDHTTITENYLYVPFSVGSNGAKAHVTSKLQFTGSSKENPTTQCNKPRSIIFENPHPVNVPGTNAKTIFDTIKEAVGGVDEVVGEKTASKFNSLVKTLRVSSKNDLLTVYNQIKSGAGVADKQAAKRFFLDALLRAGNADSVDAVIELLNRHELDEIETELAYIGLSFVRHASEGALNTAVKLLSAPKLPRSAYLGIGNLAARFCKQHPCDNVPAIKALADKLLTKLVAKPADREKENDAVYAIKAIGNLHFLPDNVVQKLISVAQDKNGATRVRVAALEAYVADPCKDKLRDNALRILQDIQQDSEIRIKAYLALTQCPNAKIGNAIKTLIEKEPSIQVGGFIVSHLRNVRASANPDKALAKQFLSFEVQKRFPIDPRKWSFNGEFSYNIDTLGLASTSDANVIYSQNSWLPRSSSLNLTAEIFGHNFNFLEIEARQENLDKLVEHYVGPKGVLRGISLKQIAAKLKPRYDKFMDNLEAKLKSELHRSKRDVSNAEIKDVSKKIHLKTNELNKDLDLDVSLKLFGSEVGFWNLYSTKKYTPDVITDKLVAFLGKRMDDLKNFKHTLRANQLFLDAEIDYPTSLGFPLRLAAEGVATTQIKGEGNIDVRQLLKTPAPNDLRLKLIPSVNIEVTGRLTLDALVVENGLRTISTLYSSTGADLSVSWLDKDAGFDVKLGVPLQEQKLISANHEIVFHTREQSGHENNLPLKFTQVKDFSICLDQLSAFIGLTFCAEINGPNLGGEQVPILPFPLAGDAKISVTIENDDVKEFHIKQAVTGERSGHAELILETIGKDAKRKVGVELHVERYPELYAKALFTSAIKSAVAEVRVINTGPEKALQASFALDQQEYLAKIGVQISGTPERSVYRPLLVYKVPGDAQLPVSVDGQVIAESGPGGKKYVFDNLKLKLQDASFTMNGNVGYKDDTGFTDLTITDGSNTASLKGKVQITNQNVKFNVELQNNVNNNANFNLKGEIKRLQNELDSSIQLIHGPDLSSKTSILTVTNKFFRRFNSANDFKWETKNKITYPLIGLVAQLEYEHTPKTLDYEVRFEYYDIRLGSELEAKIDEKTKGDYEVEFELWGLSNRLELKSKRQVLTNDESKISHSLSVNDKRIEVDGKVRHHIRPQNLDVGADLTLKLPTHNAPIKLDTGLKVTTEEVDAHNKITAGSEVLVDCFLKLNKEGDANGNVKINIKEVANVAGEIQAQKGKGQGHILVDLPKAKRQIKADANFNVQVPTQIDLTVNLYPSFDKDKNNKISLTTHNKITETEISTTNKLDVLGRALEVNAKVAKHGDVKNGDFNGDVEVTLPGDQYIQGKLTTDHKDANGYLTGQTQSSLEYRNNKNAPGKKLSYKSSWKNTNPKEGILDIDSTISADDSNGHNINLDLHLKRNPQGEESRGEYSTKIYGSMIKESLDTKVLLDCKKNGGKYDMVVSYGPANVLDVKGSIDIGGEGKPTAGNIKTTIRSSSRYLKTADVELAGSVLKPVNPATDHLVLQGKVNIFGEGKDAVVKVKSQGELKLGVKDGRINGDLAVGTAEPVSLVASYSHKETKDSDQLTGSASIGYGQGKAIKADGHLEKIGNSHYKVRTVLQTPAEEYKRVELNVETKRTGENDKITGSAALVIDDKKWQADGVLTLSEVHPLIDVKVKNPQGKLTEAYLKGNKISDKEFDGEVRLISESRQFRLHSDVDVSIESINQFSVKGKFNSPSLKANNVLFELVNKGGGKIDIKVEHSNKNVISGSTNYASKEEDGKFIAEGSGTFKVGEETKSGNFKYILHRLTLEKNGEIGSDVSLDIVLGNKAVDCDFKASNKQFRLQTSYCEEKKECAYVEIDNKINSNDAENFNQVLEINLDLRKLGLSHEFGLKAVTKRKEWILDHTVDAHFQDKEKSKYQYSVYIHPKESGITLTTPKRIVSLEGKVNIPEHLWRGGKGTGELAFFIDKKNNPNKKTALTWFLDVENESKFHGEVKFNHPGLQRPLIGSFKATKHGKPTNGGFLISSELDIFAQPNQKIVSSYKQDLLLDGENVKAQSIAQIDFKSTGLGIDIDIHEVMLGDKAAKVLTYDLKVKSRIGQVNTESIVYGKVSPKEVNTHLKLFNVNVLKTSHKLNINDQEQIIDSEISSFREKVVVSHLELKTYNTLAYSIGYKNSNEKLQINAGLIPGQIADIRSDYLSGNSKVNLFHATVKLDEADFLKSDYNVDSKEIQKVLGKVKQASTSYVKGLEDISKEWLADGRKGLDHLSKTASKSAPNLQPLKNFYAKEFQEVKDEILQDKSIKELSEALRKVLGTLLTTTSEIIEKLSDILEQVVKTVENSFTAVINLIDKDLTPLLKEIGGKILNVAKEVIDIGTNIILTVVAKISEIIEKYQPELKELAAVFGEFGQTLGRLLQNSYQQIRQNLKEIIDKIVTEVKTSPIIEQIKEQYTVFIKDGLPDAEGVVNAIKEIFNTIKEILPADMVVKKDIGQVLDLISDYAEKKLTGQNVDDLVALEKIVKSIVTLLSKVVNSITFEEQQQLAAGNLDASNYLTFNYVKNLPRLVAAKFSPITYALQHDLTDEVGDFLLSLVTKPKDLFAPFPLYGVIVQGQHIFTFDGKHFTFPGVCNYLLVGDAYNGNFTLVGSYKSGQLTAVTLGDKTDSITLVKGGQLKFNNAAAELPIRKPNLVAYRDYEIITLRSPFGIVVECVPDLTLCTVSVSGFYHSQLRGLLGNGNHEPFDDLALPDGKIISVTSDFGNAYKTKGACADVAPFAHEHVAENPKCKELFSWKSEMRYCYPFLPTENFKAACSQGLASNVPGIEESIAKAYVANCHKRHIPVNVPEQFVKCTNGDKPYSLGDTFSVKLPSKAADVVFLVDTSKDNEEVYKQLVQNLVQNIGKELHSKGVDDVEYHLITYGGENQWPSHVTVNGKLTFKGGKVPQVKFSSAPEGDDSIEEIVKSELKIAAETLKSITNDINLATGKTLQTKTYDVGYRYPFRAHALKTIVAVVGSTCEIGRLYPLQRLRAFFYTNNLISLNLFTPFTTLTHRDDKKAKDIVGFNSVNVFTLSQGKKNPRGSAELHKELNYEDFCVEFTIKNRGNVFVNDNFLANKAEQKQFVQISASNIVDQMINIEQGLDCKCQMVNPWYAQNVCTEAFNKPRPSKKV